MQGVTPAANLLIREIFMFTSSTTTQWHRLWASSLSAYKMFTTKVFFLQKFALTKKRIESLQKVFVQGLPDCY